MTEKAKEKDFKKLIAGIIVVAVIVIFLFLPMIPVEVAYSETEPYNRLAKYQVVSATLREGWDLARGTYHTSEIVVKNIDSKDGTFTVTHYLYDVNGLYGIKTTSEYLAAGQTKTFRAEFDTQWLQDVRGEYTVSAPTVIDQRVVAKHKTVYKSIIELLIYR
jgi:hypothetical protein